LSILSSHGQLVAEQELLLGFPGSPSRGLSTENVIYCAVADEEA